MFKNIQRKIFSKFNDEFSKNIFKVFSGSSVAYIIAFASLPILTRIYTVDDFGNFQLLTSIILLFSIIGSLKYELAIVLPKEEDEADKITALSFISIVFTTLLFGFLFIVAGIPILDLLDALILVDYIPLLILGIFFNSLYLALQYVFIRNKEFGVLSKNRILETSLNVVASVVLGFLKFNFLGLFYSKIFSLGYASTLILIREKLIRLTKLKISQLKETAKKYKKFPLINTPMVLINTLALELPVFMMSNFFTPEIIGLYALARRVLNLPISLIGKSFGQVFYQSAAEAYQKDANSLMKIYMDTVKKLALIGILPVAFSLIAPFAFNFIFGSEWTQAGVYVQLMIFWIYFQFINSPISTIYSIIDKQELALIINVISLILKAGVMLIFNSTPEEMLLALSIVTGLFYIAFNFSIYVSIKRMI